MLDSLWRRWRNRQHPARRTRVRPSFEALEERLTPAMDVWQGPAGGLWSVKGNWSLNAPPSSQDIAVFDPSQPMAANTDSIIDAAFQGSVLGVSIAPGYTQTLTLQRDLTVGTGGFSQEGGTFQENGNPLTVAGDFSLADTATFTPSPAGSLTFNGTGTLTDGTTAPQDLGNVTVTNNSTRPLAGAAQVDALTVDAGSTLDLAGNNLQAASLSGGGTIANSSLEVASTLTVATDQTDTFGGTLTDTSAAGGQALALTLTGTGTLVLTGANSYAGTTTVSAGVLQVGDGGSTGTLGTGDVLDNASLVLDRGDSLTVGNLITGTGGLTQEGTGLVDLTNADSYGGPTAVQAGALRVDPLGALTATSAVTVNGGTLQADGSVTSAVTVNSGGTLSGNGTIDGAVRINAGGTVAPGGSPGNLTVNGDVTFAAGSQLSEEVGFLPELQFDTLTVSGTATLNSLAVVPTLLSGFVPTLNLPFSIVHAAGGVTVNGPPTSTATGGVAFGFTEDPTDLNMIVTPPLTAYVDLTWAGTANLTDPLHDPIGGLFFGYNAFADAQAAVNAVAPGGTVVVYAGSYPAALNVNKPLTALEVSANPLLPADGTTVSLNGAVTLTDNATIQETGVGAGAAAADLAFGSTVDAAVAGGAGLVIDGSRTLTFSGPVGGSAALASLTTGAGGATVLNGGPVTTTGAQTYGNAVPLGVDTTLTSTVSGNITLAGTVDGGHALTVDTAGVTTFGGAVGGQTPLTSVATDAAGSTVLAAGTIHTTATQTYNDPVTLGADDTLTSDGSGAAGAIIFAGTVDGGFNLTVDTAGTATFGAAVGGTTALVSVTTGAAGTTALNGGSVTTTGDQSFGNPVTLGVDTTLTSTSAGNIGLLSTVDGGHALTVDTPGVTTFGGAVGGQTPLTSLTTDAAGSTALDGGPVSTTGDQTFGNPVVLGADTTLTSTGSGNVTLAGAVDGAFRLTVDTAGTTTFGGAVGSKTALVSVTTDAAGTTALNGGPVTTTGAQTYNDPVTLGTDDTLISTGSGTITLARTVDGGHALTVDTTGTTTFGGAVGGQAPLASLTTGAAGSTALDSGSVTTTGDQTFGNAIVLGADTSLVSTGSGNVSLLSTVDGAFTLAVDTAGTTTFGGTVGGTTALVSVITDAAGVTVLAAGTVTTTGAQTFNDPVALGTDDTLTSTGSGTITLARTVDGGHALTVDTAGITTFGDAVGSKTALVSVTTDAAGSTALDGGPVTTTGAQTYNDPVTLGADATLTGSTVSFGGTVDAAVDGARGLTVVGNASFGGAVGAGKKLSGLSVTLGTALDGGSVTTTGSQSYGGPVTLGADTTLTSTSSGNISLLGTVDGAFTLTVDTAGVTTFGGAVGGQTPLTSVATDAAGSTVLAAGTIHTTATQTYSDPVTLGADDTLTSDGTGAAGAITFASTVDGGHALTVNTAGTSTFARAVGGTTALASIITGTAGSTALDGGSVTTTGDQSFGNPVTLGTDTTLTSTGSGNVTLVGTVDGAFRLTVNTAGATTFGGAVGSKTALISVTTDAAGSTALDGGPVTTTGDQTFGDAVTLGANTTLASTGSGNVTLAGAVDGAFRLTVDTAGTTTFGGAVGGKTALVSVTTDAAGSTALNGGPVTTTGAQTYNDPVTLGTDDTLISTGSGTITLARTVDGGHALTVDTTGTTTFSGAVGGQAPLTRVTTDAAGTTDLNAGTVATAGDQTFGNAVTLGADTTLTSTGSGDITLAGTVDGAFRLAVDTAGTTTFGGAVGGKTALVSVTTDAAGSTALNGGPVTTTGDQTYNDPVTLGADTTLTATGSGNITLASTVNGAFALVVDTAGTTTFGGAVGGQAPLTSVTTGADGTTALDGGLVHTTATQTYDNPVTLGADTTLTTDNANLTFGSTVDGAQVLTIATGTGNVLFQGAVGNRIPLVRLTVNGAQDVISPAITASTIVVVNDTGTSTFAGLLHATGPGGLQMTGLNFVITGGITLDAGPGTITSRGTLQVSGPAVQLNGNALTVTDVGTADSISSPVQGTAASSLTKAGTGTLILTGTNTYGATTIAAGTLQIGNGGTAGTLGTGPVTDDAGLHFLRSDPLTAPYTVPNVINGTGRITVSDGAVLLTSPNSGFSGRTTVLSQLLVDGSLAFSPVAVSGGALLAGAGTVGPVAVSPGGTLSPGHAELGKPGVLAAGGLTLDPGAVLSALVDGPDAASYSRLIATGRAPVELDGAVLTIALGNGFQLGTPGAMNPPADEAYQFVQNGTGLPTAGRLATIVVSNGGPALLNPAFDEVPDAAAPGGAVIPEATVFTIDGTLAQLSYLGVQSGGAVTNDVQLTTMSGTSDRLFVLGIFRDLLRQTRPSPVAVEPYVDELQQAGDRLQVARELWGDYPANTPHAIGGPAEPLGPNLVLVATDFARRFNLPLARTEAKLYGHLDSSGEVLLKLLLRVKARQSNGRFIASVFAAFLKRKAGSGVLGGMNQGQWLGLLNAGDSRRNVLALILSSAEVKRIGIKNLEKQFHHPVSSVYLVQVLNQGANGFGALPTNGLVFADVVATQAVPNSYAAKVAALGAADAWNTGVE